MLILLFNLISQLWVTWSYKAALFSVWVYPHPEVDGMKHSFKPWRFIWFLFWREHLHNKQSINAAVAFISMPEQVRISYEWKLVAEFNLRRQLTLWNKPLMLPFVRTHTPKIRHTSIRNRNWNSASKISDTTTSGCAFGNHHQPLQLWEAADCPSLARSTSNNAVEEAKPEQQQRRHRKCVASRKLAEPTVFKKQTPEFWPSVWTKRKMTQYSSYQRAADSSRQLHKIMISEITTLSRWRLLPRYDLRIKYWAKWNSHLFERRTNMKMPRGSRVCLLSKLHPKLSKVFSPEESFDCFSAQRFASAAKSSTCYFPIIFDDFYFIASLSPASCVAILVGIPILTEKQWPLRMCKNWMIAAVQFDRE